MRLISLCAGKGTRLLPVTADRPKPLAPIGDDLTIFDLNAFSAAASLLIDEIVAVIGYKSAFFETYIDEREYPIPITTVRNTQFDSTGPIYSISRALQTVGGHDFIVQNGDTIFSRLFFDQVVEQFDEQSVTVVVSRPDEYDDDAMKVILDEGEFSSVGKSVSSVPDAISAGFVAIRGSYCRKLFEQVMQAVFEEDGTQSKRHWHSLLNDLNQLGAPIDVVEVDNSTWKEIDTVEDLEEAKSIDGLY